MDRFSLTKKEKDKVAKAYECQNDRDNKHWNFYDERQFIENLLQTRFNFLLGAFGVFIGFLGMSNGTSLLQSIVIPIIGIITTIVLGITVYRLYVKLMILLNIMRALNDYHVTQVTDPIVKRVSGSGSGVNHLIGVVIPVAIPLFLLAMLLISQLQNKCF